MDSDSSPAPSVTGNDSTLSVTPVDNGVTGTQQPGRTGELMDATPPLQGLSIHEAFIDLTFSLPNKFGKDYVPLIAAFIREGRDDSNSHKTQLDEKQAKIDQLKDELATEKLLNLELSTKLSESRKTHIIKQLCTFVSPALFSIAIDLYKSNSNLSYLIATIGAMLLLVNFIGNRGQKQ